LRREHREIFCARGAYQPAAAGRSALPLDAMNDPWWKSLSWIMWLALTRIFGPLMALGWPLFYAYGLLQPHTLYLEALRLGRGEVALPIGASSAQRSYVVLPRAIATASVSVVNDQHRARVPLRETRATLLLSCSFGSPPFIAPGTSGFAPCQRHLTNAWSGRES
jgi:hypothetical protein